jgi:hypothetical protein
MSGSLYVDGLNGLFVGTDNGSDDDKIKMDSGSEYLMWDEDPNRFYLSDDLYLSGKLTVGGVYASQLAYNSIGYVGTGEPSTDITDFRDLFVDDSIEAGDSVYAQDFKYSATKTCYLNIPACAFVKNEYYVHTVWVSSASGYNYTSNTGSTEACTTYSPVYLPEGAIVTDVEVRYYDNHTTENVYLEFSLRRIIKNNTGTAVLASALQESSGTSSGIRAFSDNSIHFNPISVDYSYYLYLYWNPTAFSSNLRFYGATITYTVDKISP